MDIHKPKAAHSWREFAVEIGTIVCGIVIALGGEQAVEAAHWSHRVSEAETQMRAELTEDNGPQAYLRLSQSSCISGQLDSLDKALLAERDTHVPFVARPVIAPTFFTWDSDAYRQAMASSTIAHMSPERGYAWSSPYTLAADMDSTSLREANDYAELGGAATAPPHPSEALRERLLAAVARARGDNTLLSHLAGKLIRFMQEPGVTLTNEQKRLLFAGNPKSFLACGAVVEP
jgi:hypothetical protein